MPVEEQLATIFEVLEGGVETTAEVIPFPVDSGATALEGTTTAVQLGNGVATEVSQLTVVEGGATTTAGVGLLALDVGAAGAAIAPALGILAGVGLYNLAPEFWTNVANKLMEAGQTVGGKVRAFLNSGTKQAGFSKETIEIFKQAFIDAGLFTDPITFPDYDAPKIPQQQELSYYKALGNRGFQIQKNPIAMGNVEPYDVVGEAPIYQIGYYSSLNRARGYGTTLFSTKPFTLSFNYNGQPWDSNLQSTRISYTDNTPYYYWQYTQGIDISTIYYQASLSHMLEIINSDIPSNVRFDWINFSRWLAGYLLQTDIVDNPSVQPDATLPTTDPFPTTYPTWIPWSVPVEGFPDVYPIEIPAINPEPNQSETQNPSALPNDNPDLLPWFITVFPQPDPNPNPYPEPVINPDPDPAPEPEPIPEPEPEPTPDNPPNPNPDPSSPFLPVVPDMPDTVESNAMFTVYKPSMAQVNSFGGWLWSSNIVEQIKRIWQNPLDGIISFMKVYVNAPTSGSDTIKVGILDSGVSSPVVSGQFVTVECGSLNVREKFYNATDYSPFVAMHLYLPFIGIVELDIDEFMSGEIKVTYHVDVYTGTCLAEVKSRRSPDMPEWTIVYTFSGNASQQLPLTSAEFSGALSSLVGVVGGGLAIASGGGLGLLAGASGIAHAVSHEMVHLAHSGSLSANAGIMGARKPYLILTRRRGYDANGYNELYGYPSNKTVYLNNCSGYVKVKDIRLETSATEDERLEIENLLKSGVII